MLVLNFNRQTVILGEDTWIGETLCRLIDATVRGGNEVSQDVQGRRKGERRFTTCNATDPPGL